MYKGIIFDLDGTLLNTLEDLAEAINQTLKANGEPTHSLDAIRSFVGNGNRNLLARSLSQGEAHPDFDRYMKEYLSYYFSHDTVYTHPYDGINELISYCKEPGLPIGIVTNKLHEAAIEIVEHYFPNTFDIIVGDIKSRPRKPAPDGIYEALTKMGTKKEETLYVGDSPVDYESSVNSGLDCVLCTWGFCGADELRQLGAKYVVDHPSQIEQIFHKLHRHL